MGTLKEFRKANSLTQEELAKYLGDNIGKAFICQIEKGGRKLPQYHLAKLLNNDMGWDTSMLLDSPTITASGNAEVNVHSKNRYADNSELKKENEMLLQKIAMLEEKIQMLGEQLIKAETMAERYWKMIESKM